MKRSLKIIAVALWASLIFALSAQPATVSQHSSNHFIERGAELILHRELSSEEKQNYNDKYSFIVRKSAHFSLYLILGILLFLLMDDLFKETIDESHPRPKSLKGPAIAFVTAVLYSLSDEFHQNFVTGRSCELRDILIDSAGATLGIVLMLALSTHILKAKLRRHYKKGHHYSA